jgi:hypothetical protein
VVALQEGPNAVRDLEDDVQFRPRNRYVRQAPFRSSARYGVKSE